LDREILRLVDEQVPPEADEAERLAQLLELPIATLRLALERLNRRARATADGDEAASDEVEAEAADD
jgi:hypothetical protein